MIGIQRGRFEVDGWVCFECRGPSLASFCCSRLRSGPSFYFLPQRKRSVPRQVDFCPVGHVRPSGVDL